MHFCVAKIHLAVAVEVLAAVAAALPRSRSHSQTQAFIQRRFCSHKLLHTGAFTHRSFYTQKPLHTESFYTQKLCTQHLLHTGPFTHRSIYTQALLHTEAFKAFTHRCHSLIQPSQPSQPRQQPLLSPLFVHRLQVSSAGLRNAGPRKRPVCDVPVACRALAVEDGNKYPKAQDHQCFSWCAMFEKNIPGYTLSSWNIFWAVFLSVQTEGRYASQFGFLRLLDLGSHFNN